MKRNEPAAKLTRRSRAFRRAQAAAEELMQQPQKLVALLGEAGSKIAQHGQTLGAVTQPLMTAIRLLRCYASGEYRQLPTRSLLMILAAVVYFVMPADAIPDPILALGLLDDAALLGWTLNALKNDLDDFSQWEAQQTTDAQSQPSSAMDTTSSPTTK